MKHQSKSQPKKRRYEPKPEFVERMNKLLPDENDFKKYQEILNLQPVKSIRCNTLKISPEDLIKKLEEKGWRISQPWKEQPEIMIVESELEPGILGRALEHMLGYYYIQELSSMLPIIALKPKENEILLDICAAPGSKTTQAAALINNTGTIIANEISMGRMKILASNLEKNGATNTIITRKDGIALCRRLEKINIIPDKILLDAPCSGEGTIRSTPVTYQLWNMKTIYQLSNLQKQLFASAFHILKVGGEMVYSTCTHAPEEDEQVVNWALKHFGDSIKIEKIKLPVKTREGISKWKEHEYLEDVKYSCRVYPHDNNTEGFFLAKFTKIKEIEE
jgi:NOL1/NOP2/sun family putative RNA methylase